MLAEHDGTRAARPPAAISARPLFGARRLRRARRNRSRTRSRASSRRKPGSRSRDVRYVASQPWPFPSSLMIGCMRAGARDELTIDYYRARGRALVHAATRSRRRSPARRRGRSSRRRRSAIARTLLEHWLALEATPSSPLRGARKSIRLGIRQHRETSWTIASTPSPAGCCSPASSRLARRSSPARCSTASGPRRWAIRSRAWLRKAKAAPPPSSRSSSISPRPIRPRAQQVFKKCTACHNADKGGANQLGPNLWGVLGEPIGQGRGFAFSDALAKKGGNWNWDNLSQWLTSPQAFAPGTKMTFAGLGNPAGPRQRHRLPELA